MTRVLLAMLFSAYATTALADEWSRDFPHEHRSRHFVVRYQRDGWDAAAFARFAEAFIETVNRDFVRVKLERPSSVRSMRTRRGASGARATRPPPGRRVSLLDLPIPGNARE